MRSEIVETKALGKLIGYHVSLSAIVTLPSPVTDLPLDGRASLLDVLWFVSGARKRRLVDVL